jgi:uncharacterized protein involved in cysteine biosynthesis
MTTTSNAPGNSFMGWRSEALLLAALPFVGSLLALVFEAGFLSFFDVPLLFTQIDFVRIVRATFLVGVFFSLVLGGLFVAALLDQHPHPLCRRLGYPAFVAALFAPPFFYFAPTQFWKLVVLVMLIVLIYLLPPLFSRRGKSYLGHLDEMLEKEKLGKEKAETVSRPLANAIKKIFALLFALFWVTVFVFALGRDQAESRTVHYVLQGSPDWVLVTAYGDTLLLKTFNSRTRVIGTTLRLQKPADPTTTILVRRNIGSLIPPAKEP